MELIELELKHFLNKVASNEVSPAGGSVCALCGALGSALSQMVCNVSVNKKEYEKYSKEISAILNEIKNIQSELNALIDKDKIAFSKVYEVIKISKDDKNRKMYMENALKDATLVPFEILENSYKILKLIENFASITNKNSLADLGVCAIMLKASIEGAYLTINFNLSKIKDEKFVSKYKIESLDIYKNSIERANIIYSEILQKTTEKY